MGRHRRDETADPFRLLLVCTGNICRSPFAAILLQHELVGRLGGRVAAAFDIHSAGVDAVDGAAMHPDTRSELAPWNLDRAVADRFRARQLQARDIERADLILGMAQQHRSAVTQQCPSALPYTFTLREFVGLVGRVERAEPPNPPVAWTRALVEHARWRRGTLTPAVDGELPFDVPDPMGRPRAAHHLAAVLIADAVRALAQAIGASTGPAPSRSPDAGLTGW